MKKTVFYKAITQVIAALVLSLVFSACSGVGLKAPSSSETNQSDIKYAVTGTIILNGAFPSINNSSAHDTSRTAATSLKLSSGTTLAVTDFNFSVTNVATEKPEEQALVIAKIDETTSKITYAAVFKASGKYKISCGLWNNTYFGESDVIEVKQTTTLAPAITLLPANCNPATQTNIRLGSVDLTIEDQSGKLSSVVYKGFGSDQEGTAAFANGSAHLQLSNVSPNNYEVTFNFNDLSGNTLYSHKEVVAVLPGFVTDTWFPAGSFAITDEMIAAFGTEVVQSTDYLMYDKNGSNFNYYVINSLEVLDDLPENPTFTETSGSNYICFDANGYYYVMTSQGGSSTWIKSNNPNFGEPGTQENEPRAKYLDRSFDSFLIDRKTGIMYCNELDSKMIVQITDANGDDTDVPYYLVEEINGSHIAFDKPFTVYDGVAYLAKLGESEGETSYLYVGRFTDAQDNGGDDEIVVTKKQFPSFVDDNQYTDMRVVTDMLYQDGYVYILLRYVDLFPYNLDFYSTGCVIRFNTFTNTFDDSIVGFANPIEYSDDAYVQTMNNGNAVSYFLKAKDITKGSAQALNFYSPYTTEDSGMLTLSTKAFYGPQKFIALKPKKLVIADDGVAFYTDNFGAYKYKNVNRVVEIDLEKFSAPDLEFESHQTYLEFDFEESNGSNFIYSSNNSGSYWSSLNNDIDFYFFDAANNYNVQAVQEGLLNNYRPIIYRQQ